MRGWVKGAVTAAVVLGVGGWIAEPYAQDWLLIGSACDGALPREAVEELVPGDGHLETETSRRSAGLGSYTCSLTLEGESDDGRRFIEVDAYTRRDDQDREFMAVFPEEGFSPQAPLPDGMPGFVDKFGDVQLLLPCPDLGEDADGRQRKLLVRTALGRDADYGVPGAAYETAVAVTNAASEQLGCGAKPLTVPEGDPVLADPEDDPKTMPLPEAKGTPCGWLTEAGLPRDTDWRVAARMNDVGITGRCDLYAESGGTSGEPGPGMSFLAWYGDWSNRLVSHGGDGEPRSMTATARCDGEAANYRMSAGDDIPGIDEAARRRLLKEFARAETERRGCTDLRSTF